MSNVEFGSPSPKVSIETSYRGIGKSHMVLRKSAILHSAEIPLPQETGTHIPRGHSFQQLRRSCGPVLQRSDR